MMITRKNKKRQDRTLETPPAYLVTSPTMIPPAALIKIGIKVQPVQPANREATKPAPPSPCCVYVGKKRKEKKKQQA